jgi:hypothetical protein
MNRKMIKCAKCGVYFKKNDYEILHPYRYLCHNCIFICKEISLTLLRLEELLRKKRIKRNIKIKTYNIEIIKI